MAIPKVVANPIPTGGCIGLNLTTAVSGAITLSRAVSGASGLSPFVTLYSGAPLSNTGEATYYLDIGDQTPGPLQAGTIYVYQLTDVNGTVQSGPVATPSNITVEIAEWTQIIIGILQGAISTATFPEGVRPARVMNAMPLSGNVPPPSIFVNPEVTAQEALPIGVDNENAGDLIQPGTTNIWTQTEQDRFVYRITIFSLNAVERDFYKYFIVSVLRIAIAYALSQAGADSSRSFEAASYQENDQTNLTIPGFYGCDILYEFTATANVKVTTNYGLIETILGDFALITFLGEGPDVQVQVPILL